MEAESCGVVFDVAEDRVDAGVAGVTPPLSRGVAPFVKDRRNASRRIRIAS